MTYFWDYLRSPAGHAILLAMAGTAAAAGLVALWAARGNVHWFWRALAVWATAALFIPVRAYDLAFLFPLATLLLLAGFRIARWISSRRARQEHAEAGPLGWAAVRFRLHDLFLLVLLVALVIVTFQAIPLPPAAAYGWQNWVAVAGWAALLATIWSLAYGCTVTRRPLAVAVLTSIAIAGASFALAALSNLRQWVLSSSLTALWALREPSTLFPRSYADEVALLTIIHAEVALLIVLFVVLAHGSFAVGAPRGRTTWSRGALAALASIGVVALGWLYAQMLWLTPLTKFVGTGPNHYRQIIAIARHFEPPPADFRFTRRPQPPAVPPNKDQLIAELSVLLEAPNFVVLNFPEDVSGRDINAQREEMRPLLFLIRALHDDAKAKSERGEPDKAVRALLLLIRLDTMQQRGNVEYGSVESALSYAMDGMARIRSGLPPESIRTFLAALRRADGEREPLQAILRRALAVNERADGWRRRFVVIFRSLAGLESSGYGDPDSEWNRQFDLYGRMLRTELNVRLFQHDRGRLPESLDELVPDYLPAIPIDLLANSREPLRYRRDGDQFSVYSVGKDGLDNGGVFGTYRTYWLEGYDCNLETWASP